MNPFFNILSSVVALAGAFGVGCTSAERAMQPTHPLPDVTTRIEDLQFQEPRSQTLHAALRAHAMGRTSGWNAIPLHQVGNFVEERWCSPAVSPQACRSGAMVNDETPGTAWITLGTLFYPLDWPQVFGVVYHAADLVPPWGVQVHLYLRGRTVTGSSFSATFLRYEGGKVVERLEVPSTWSYKVAETTFSVPPPPGVTGLGKDETNAGNVEAEISRLVHSPSSFRETVLERIESLRAEVDRGIEAHEARKAILGPYEGDGIPPLKTLVPLSLEEEVLWSSRAQKDLDAMRATVSANAEILHRRLLDVLPSEPWK